MVYNYWPSYPCKSRGEARRVFSDRRVLHQTLQGSQPHQVSVAYEHEKGCIDTTQKPMASRLINALSTEASHSSSGGGHNFFAARGLGSIVPHLVILLSERGGNEQLECLQTGDAPFQSPVCGQSGFLFIELF